MSEFYIYSSKYNTLNDYAELVPRSVTFIFSPNNTLSEKSAQTEIKEFYQTNYQTDEIIIIGGTYQQKQLEETFIINQLSTFKNVPKLKADHLAEHVHVMIFNKDGQLTCCNRKKSIDNETLNKLLNIGIVLIFKNRGGLIEAKGDAHHFIFPSGKHCDKFLRTGNVLMNTAEIYFIAFRLLGYFNENKHKKIFCDTSSINTLAFALAELKSRFVKKLPFIPIESFSSYEGLFSKKVRFFNDSLILISSSTSGNIIERILEHDESVDSRNIIIIYFLGSSKEFKKKEHNILSNLTLSENNPVGFELYDTYTGKECSFCAKGSFPVEVKGDVFLLEKPKVNKLTIRVTDAPKRLADFVQQFMASMRFKELVFKVNYKETYEANRKYEIYFDIYQVLNEIENPRYKKYRLKLYDFINQFIPSNAKFLIALPDEGSKKLAAMILNHLKLNYIVGQEPKIVDFDNVAEVIVDEKVEGAAVIIASCISNGKNLLYLSRAFRNYERLKLIYFIGLTRTHNQEDLDFLKSNLRQGNYGKETHSFVEVESFFCNRDVKGTNWLNEKEFIQSQLLPLANAMEYENAKHFLEERVEIINDSQSKLNKGLANELFYPSTDTEQLELRKGFAFINFGTKFEDLSQADVYFTISAILNQLRNAKEQGHCLRQSEYVRNLIDPGNFNRFNDGIIQASILRGARTTELAYRIDDDASLNMKLILEKIISEHHTPQGEGLIEFLYAIATQKLTLKQEHLEQLSHQIDQIHNNELVLLFNKYIKNEIIKEKPTLQQKITDLENQNQELFEKIALLEAKILR
ncbi:hypothetical protein [Mucilaginibacter ginkgonis]|uniref:Uncharacterized protein n=1 Tax=Mucilaginibacter ginkgonis TaxID=2682091 RepID=A0A6I4HY34_9SPHI|nr:hypothetical protein [Mucilaginibacter ginkgonis]QQL51213.1 hypothetical protein GO620_007125 [Mucilaginibacter ginkgonis]